MNVILNIKLKNDHPHYSHRLCSGLFERKQNYLLNNVIIPSLFNNVRMQCKIPLVRYSEVYCIDSLYSKCLLFRCLLYRLVLAIEGSTLVPVEYHYQF